MAAYRRVDDLRSPAGRLYLYIGISSGPNARYRVWEAFTFTFIYRRVQQLKSQNCWTSCVAVDNDSSEALRDFRQMPLPSMLAVKTTLIHSVPRERRTLYGRRSFCIDAPTVRNNLPTHLRTHDIRVVDSSFAN